MQTVKIIIEDGRIEQFNEEVMKEFDNFIGRSDIINSNFIKNFIAQKLTAHKELILKMVRESAGVKIMEEIDNAFTPLYLEVEASVAEHLHCLIKEIVFRHSFNQKTLILNKIREEAPKIGWGITCEEFLNNLDTI